MRDWWDGLSWNPVNSPIFRGSTRNFCCTLPDKEGELLTFIGTVDLWEGRVVNYEYFPLNESMRASVEDYLSQALGVRGSFSCGFWYESLRS